MSYPYWQRQTQAQPLFPDIEWSRPEQLSRAGKLGIIGGNKLGFAGVAESYDVAKKSGIGEVRVLLPDALKRTIPSSMTDVVFGAANPSGGLARDAAPEARALAHWSSSLLMSGDAGRNSETAILYEDLIRDYEGLLIITRDAVDLIKNSSEAMVNRPNTLLVVSFAQLQKIFQSVYYPKVLTFSMQLMQLVEAVHKFTITYPVTIAVLHKDTFIVAHGGQVTTTAWDRPMMIWRGGTAARAAVYWSWNPTRPLEAVTTSLLA